MRWVSALIAIASIVTAGADEFDDAINAVLRADWRSQRKLVDAPTSVDPKILAALQRIAESKQMRNRQGVDMLSSVLNRRFFGARSNGVRGGIYDPNDYRALRILMRLRSRYSVELDQVTYGRGPAFYSFLLQTSKSSRPERTAAIAVLARTAMIHCRKPGPGDPALIRLFRRERNIYALAGLRDRASIPLMRSQVKSKDYDRRQVAAWSLIMIKDHEAVPLLVTLLADPPELRHGPSESFGPAGSALRELAQPRHEKLILRYVQRHSGYPRAFAINVLGRIGDNVTAKQLREFLNDSNGRVRKAAKAAILALGG